MTRTIPKPVRDAKPLPDYAVTERFLEYFWSRVHVDGDCWSWTGTISDAGYGVLQVPGEPYNFQAHRVSYMVAIGPVPLRKVLDHLCFNRACVNPGHLQVSDHYVNWYRRDPSKAAINATHCAHGHEYTAVTSYAPPNRPRQCRECNREACARYHERKRTAAAA